MLSLKVTSNPTVIAGDSVQDFVKQEKRRDEWLNLRVNLNIDNESGIVSVPGSSDRPVSVAAGAIHIVIVVE